MVSYLLFSSAVMEETGFLKTSTRSLIKLSLPSPAPGCGAAAKEPNPCHRFPGILSAFDPPLGSHVASLKSSAGSLGRNSVDGGHQ